MYYFALKLFLTMNILFVLISIGLLVALGFLGAFLWAVKSGQYDDDYTPSVRILFDDTPQTTQEEKTEEKEKPHLIKDTRN